MSVDPPSPHANAVLVGVGGADKLQRGEVGHCSTSPRVGDEVNGEKSSRLDLEGEF